MNKVILVMMILVGILASSVAVFGQGGDLAPPEQVAMSDTVQNALENNKSNQSSDWVNPDTGNSGGVTPVRTFEGPQGQPCREFISTIIIGGEQQQGYGTACRQPDGSWQIVSSGAPAAQEPPPETQTNVYVYNPPPEYYAFPSTLYYPYRIYLSFGYVYRGGDLYRGSFYLDGRSFRNRYPIRIHRRVYIPSYDRVRYSRLSGWWSHRDRDRDREWERDKYRRKYEKRRTQWDWRDRDRGNKPWRGRGRKDEPWRGRGRGWK